MAMNLNDHVFIVCSHPNNQNTETLTKNCLTKLKEFGAEIILSSHCNISSDLSELSDYSIVDNNNRIIDKSEYKNFNICNYVFYEDDIFYSESVKPKIYDYAVFRLIKNGITFAKGINKKYAHIVNYDCLIESDVYLKEFIAPLLHYDLCYTVWDNQINDLMSTYLFSCKINSILELFSGINNEKEYFLNRLNGWQLERLIYNYYYNKKFPIYKANYPHFNLNIASNERLGDSNILENVFLSSDQNKHVYLFIKNYPFQKFKLNIVFQKYNKFHTLEIKECLFIKLGYFNPNDTLKIFNKGKLAYSINLPNDYDDFYQSNKTQIKDNKISKLLTTAFQIGISQNKSEIIEFLHWLKPYNISNILEIGTDKGGNFYLLSNLENSGIKISIDLISSQFGEKIDVNKRNQILEKCPGKIHLINGNSHTSSTIKQIEFILKNKKLDLLFIDGDHTYEGVKQDYNNYVNFVKDGGAIVFHDIVNSESHKNQNVGVNQFWDEITGEKLEFKSNNTFWGGLGVLIKEQKKTNIIKKTTKEKVEKKININFVQGAFCEILGSDNNQKYDINFEDENKKLIHSATININCYVKCFQQFFTKYQIKILDNKTKQVIHEHEFNCQNQWVYIHIDSESLGDNIGWFPYIEEFRKKHQCKVICSTFWNHLFESKYKNIKFVDPGSVVDDLYAMYEIGLFNDCYREPESYKNIPLQKISSNILGLEYKEIKPKIYIKNDQSLSKTNNKIIAISTASTCQAKFWNYDHGWQKIIDYLIKNEYQVVLLQKELSNLTNVIKPDITDIQETITWLTKSKLYIGLSSGVSWLAWALNIPVIMISGFTKPFNEFQCIRISPQENICQGCYHDYTWDQAARKNWNYCPKHENTNRHFECTKSITADIVIDKLKILI